MASPTYAIKGLTSMSEGTAQIITFETTGLTPGSAIKYSISGVLPWRIQNNLSSGSLTVGSNGQASLYIWVNADYYTDGPSNLVVSVPGSSARLSIAVDDTTKTPSTLYTIQQAIDFYNSQRTAFNGTEFGTAAIYDSAANIAANTTLLGGSLFRVSASIIPFESSLTSAAFYSLYSSKNANTNIVATSIQDTAANVLNSLEKIYQYKSYVKDISVSNSAYFSVNVDQLSNFGSVISLVKNLPYLEIHDTTRNIGALNLSDFSDELFHIKISQLGYNATIVGGTVSQLDLREAGDPITFKATTSGSSISQIVQLSITGFQTSSTITLGQELSKLSILDRHDYLFYATYFVNSSNANIQKSGPDFSIQVNGHVDNLSSIQRFVFTDKAFAYDVNGNAGSVAKDIGAIFGASQVSNPTYVGIGLNYLDKKLGSHENLVDLALNTALGPSYTNEQEIQLLYKNLLGQSATKADINYWGNLIDSGAYTHASLAIFAANSDFNTSNINLIGLAQTGIQYIPTV